MKKFVDLAIRPGWLSVIYCDIFLRMRRYYDVRRTSEPSLLLTCSSLLRTFRSRRSETLQMFWTMTEKLKKFVDLAIRPGWLSVIYCDIFLRRCCGPFGPSRR